METPQKNDGNWGAWVLIVLLFALHLWPVALILLLIKLFGNDKKQAASTSETQRSPKETARPAKVKKAAKKVVKSPVMKESTAKRLTVWGAIFAFCGIFMLADPLQALFLSAGGMAFYLEELLQAAAFTAGGVAMLCKGRSMARAIKRYAKYLSILGDRESIEVAQLACTLGYSPRRVEKDLQKMIDRGYFGGLAYLNVARGYLFRSGEAEANAQAAAQAETTTAQANTDARTPPETETGYSGILRDIRRINDRIADPIFSGKIDRLEAVTTRIFKAVEENPQKRSRINTLLDYYLPTTQKLLNAYAEFESTGVEGENLRQAKGRIEATMDAIVAGFEHQLDELYRSDVLDVDSDIRVMETMLRRDAASAKKDFGLGKQELDLGGTAAAQAEK